MFGAHGGTIKAVTTGQAALVRLARRELPAAIADCWIGLLRPSLLLREAHDHERVIGQLGGIPVLPDGMAWPQHPDGRGPLTFIADIDCGQLPASALSLPKSGRLSFFLWDDEQAPGYLPETDPANRVVYTASRTPVTEREPPAGCAEYDLVELTGELRATSPAWASAVFREAVAGLGEEGRAFLDHWRGSEAHSFRQGLWDLAPQPNHRIGGHALPVHGEVGRRVAWVQLAGDKVFPSLAYDDPAVHREALRWTLLAQFDSDRRAGTRWGGGSGFLYWPIRTDDLATRKLEAAALTWQR